MYVNTYAPSANGSQVQSSGPNVDYQAFLKLLVAQMKNQDPTSPMDSTDYMAQLASFSNVEQSVQMNSKLDQMLQLSAMSQADALLGREVTSADGSISGIVEEVRLTNAGMSVLLDNGKELAISAGVTIREPAAPVTDDTADAGTGDDSDGAGADAA